MQPQEVAKPCDVTKCDLPDCRCSSTNAPLEGQTIPQVSERFSVLFYFYHQFSVLPTISCLSRLIPVKTSKTHVLIKYSLFQIVHLTFNEAVTSTSERFFEQLFTGEYKNPNGCNIRGTHYVSHEYTNYHLVHTYWSRGHEIGSISIS